ncbi:MAG: transporter substrate-binding domain-containing protein [Varibaculum sp.]|nr:transporter substrate-binding domain-containing protein [Varibaculum sp.]
MKKFIALALTGVFTAGALSACGATSTEPAAEGFDFSTIKADPAVEALVPQAVKDRGVLRNGASTDYPPLEMLKEDNQTPTGAEVDLAKAIALTMGLKDGTTTTETFNALLPKVGSTYDIGASGFTVTEDRVKSYDMLAYKDMGTLYGVAKSNQNKFDPTDVCGKTIGVQTGTYQETSLLPKLNKECTDAGKAAITVQKEDLLDNVIPKVISGQYDAFIADDPVVAYNVNKSNGQLEISGDIFDSTPLAIVVNNRDPQLSKAVKAAMDSLMKSGKMKEILALYGADGGMYSEVQLNSSTQE